jgi:hypothetical protein
MRRDIKTNLFDAIYFLDADRIAREVTIQTIIKRYSSTASRSSSTARTTSRTPIRSLCLEPLPSSSGPRSWSGSHEASSCASHKGSSLAAAYTRSGMTTSERSRLPRPGSSMSTRAGRRVTGYRVCPTHDFLLGLHTVDRRTRIETRVRAPVTLNGQTNSPRGDRRSPFVIEPRAARLKSSPRGNPQRDRSAVRASLALWWLMRLRQDRM